MANHLEVNSQILMQSDSEWLQNFRELCGDENSAFQELDFSQCNSPLTEKCKELPVDVMVHPHKLGGFPCDASVDITPLGRGQRWSETWQGHGCCCCCSCKCHHRLSGQLEGIASHTTVTSDSSSCDQTMAMHLADSSHSLLLPYSMSASVSPWSSSHDLSSAMAPLLIHPGDDSDSEISVLLDRDHRSSATRHNLPPHVPAPTPASIAVSRAMESIPECRWGHCSAMARTRQHTVQLEVMSIPSLPVETVPSAESTPRRTRRGAHHMRTQRHRTHSLLCASSSDQDGYDEDDQDEEDIEEDDDDGDEDEEDEEEYDGKCLQESASRPRRKASEQSRTILMDWLVAHQDHPYPTKREKEELARRTGMELKQIMHWMSNVRKRRFLPLICGKRVAESTVDVKFLQEFQKRMKR